MILPLGDQPNPRGFFPLVNYTFIFLNIAVYLLVTLPLSMTAADPRDPMLMEYVRSVAPSLPRGVSVNELVQQVSAYDLFVFSYGYRPAEGSILTLFTAMFLHGGLMHLFGNMLFLWIYGDNVEFRLGRLKYLFWYLATGVAATLFHALLDRDSPLPLVGASGAISGVLGFYFIWFPRNQVRLWLFLFPFFMNVILAPARWVLGFYLLVDNLLPFLATRGMGGGGVAHGAHIGGFLAGLVAAVVMDRRGLTRQPEEYRRVPSTPEPKSLEGIVSEAIRNGDYSGAARTYFSIPSQQTRRLLAPNDSLALGRWLAENNHPQAALAVFQRHLRDYPLGPGAGEAHAYAGLLQLYALGEPTAAYQHLVEALELDLPPETEGLVRGALAEIAKRQKLQVGRRP